MNKIFSRLLENKAEIVLRTAYEEASTGGKVSCNFSSLVDEIMLGNHLTFRYILFTALLAKASDNAINVLSLQAGAKLIGAYDARSLCHSVVVPFDQKYLKGAMGGSNEPFLNKPARYPSISLDNPVRAGADKKKLILLCEELPKIIDQEQAYNTLVYAIAVLLDLLEQKNFSQSLHGSTSGYSNSSEYLRGVKFIDQALSNNSRGEVLNLIVSSVFKYFFEKDTSVFVEVHKINQSGASSREISDLDIYKNGKILSLYELKDKNFSATDVNHAINKALNAGFYSLNFVVGRSASWDFEEIENLREEWISEGFFLNFVSVDSLVFSMIELVEDFEFGHYLEILEEVTDISRASKDTRDLINRLI
ncbi:restriction endonuclease, SacI family [Rothia sp. P5766]|uniref:restriction endonuclease, SacI family n=1 Tax=Rothia sp. P5766 TaxID=3402656 RepID=UPI003AE1E874